MRGLLKEYREELLRRNLISGTYDEEGLTETGYIALRPLFVAINYHMNKTLADAWLENNGFRYRVDMEFDTRILEVPHWARERTDRDLWTSYTETRWEDERTNHAAEDYCCPHFFRNATGADEFRTWITGGISYADRLALTVLRERVDSPPI